MLEFHKKRQKNPSKTEPEKRIKDFQEIYSQFDKMTLSSNPQDALNVEFLTVKFIVL